MTLLWIAIAIAALVLIAGYFVLQRAVTGRRYTRQALEQQMEKPAYREVKAPILAADGWVSAHEREDLHVMSYDGKLLHAIYLPQKRCEGHDSAVSRLQILLADRLRARASLLL